MSKTKVVSLSVVINTKNVEKTLEKTLKSVKFADEIVIVDMMSRDKTIEIASKYTENIFSYKDVGYVEPARNFAISKASGKWILIVDADEEVPVALKKVLEKIIKEDEQEAKIADCYYIPRKNLIFDKWIKDTGWWPDMVLRFFKKGFVEWSDEIHSIPITKGNVRELSAVEEIALVHHNYQHVSQFIERMNRYTDIQAKDFNTKVEGEITSKAIFKKFYSEILSRFFAQRGVNDGVHGLSLSLLQGLSEAVVAMKTWETKGFKQTDRGDEEDLIEEVYNFKKELSYWLANWKVENNTGLKKVVWRIRRKLYI